MNEHRRVSRRSDLSVARLSRLAALAAAMSVLTPPLLAQPEAPSAHAVRRMTRRPVIDLEKSAREVRNGQVVPEADEPGLTPPVAPPVAPPPTQRPAEQPVEPKRSPVPPVPPARPTAEPERPALSREAEPPAASADPAAPISVAGEPVKIVVLAAYAGDGEGPQAQWRAIGAGETTWRTVETGARTEERVEIRTGLSGTVRVELDGAVVVQIDRLSRVRLERRVRADASELSIELVRGRLEMSPIKTDDLGQSVQPVRIRTPDATLLRRTGVSVTYDAFKGTRESVTSAPR